MYAREQRILAREAMAQWIGTAPWELLITLTDPGMSHPEAMAKRARYLANRINRHLYGNHWQRRTAGIEYVVAYERQERGSWHAHMLLRLPDHDVDDPAQFSWKYWQRFASKLAFDESKASANFQRIRNQEAVNLYVSKYVLKDGNVDLSDSFNPAAPRLFKESLCGSARVH